MNNSEELKQQIITIPYFGIDCLAQDIEYLLSSQNKELREKIEGMRRTEDIKTIAGLPHRDGVINKGYNEALTDILSLLKFDGDIDVTHKSTDETHYSCMRMLMKRDLGCCKCDNHECRVWEEK